MSKHTYRSKNSDGVVIVTEVGGNDILNIRDAIDATIDIRAVVTNIEVNSKSQGTRNISTNTKVKIEINRMELSR